MVKVREDQPLTDSGGVDIPMWVTRLREEVPSVNADVMTQACEVALKVAREADARGDKLGASRWSVFGSVSRWPISSRS